MGLLFRYNLLVASPRDRERAARAEVQYFVGDLLGDARLRIHITRIPGLIACRTGMDPFEVVRGLRTMAEENPYQFRFAIRFTPLERCVPSDIESIVGAVRELSTKVKEDETFRVTVRRRHTSIDHMEVVHAAAKEVAARVQLDSPDWTVWIEIVGEWSGVSVLRPKEDILAIMTMRDDMY